MIHSSGGATPAYPAVSSIPAKAARQVEAAGK
jgi:hypothetical protein